MSDRFTSSFFKSNASLDNNAETKKPAFTSTFKTASSLSADEPAPARSYAEPEKVAPVKAAPKVTEQKKIAPQGGENVRKVVSPVAATIKLDPTLLGIAKEASNVLSDEKFAPFRSEIEGLTKEADKHKFTVAVVGEFSRGKSTFVNKLIGKEILPVANMPTTAILTRIRYTAGAEGITVFDAHKKQKRTLPLSVDSWEDYIADDEGHDPNGVAFVDIKCPLLKNGIEIVDTPGAGDLELKRTRVIGDALKNSDCAIITISALSAMSMSEKVFIEERLITKKTPFLMLIITKLDQVDINQRSGVIEFVRQKLKMWEMDNISVFVPYNIPMPDSTYSDIIGMDKIVNQINTWMNDSDRKNLTDRWYALQLKSCFQSALNTINEQKCIESAGSDEEKTQLIEQKTQMLQKADEIWDEVKIKMIQKADECYSQFNTKAEDLKNSLTEKMQYELSRTGDPHRWWTEDFPYRLKIEMTNFSSSTENMISKTVTKDVSWLNSVLEKNFKTSVLYTPEEVTDKNAYTNFDTPPEDIAKDMSKEKLVNKIGSTAFSLGTTALFAIIGWPTFVATIGLGTGGHMVADAIFKKKIESQKLALKDEVDKRVPVIVDNAVSYSESRIKNMYNTILSEATKQQEGWTQSQKKVIESALSSATGSSDSSLQPIYDKLYALCTKLDRFN